MRIFISFFIVFLATCGIAFAADNTKPIEATLRNHGEAVAKADEIRAKAVERSRNETVNQLVKLANKAYADKDRTSETSAWKSVLTLDRSHPKATQYFKDLGTLEKVLAELKDVGEPIGEKPKIVGKWTSRFSNGTRSEFSIKANGEVQYSNERGATNSRLVVDGDAFVVRLPELQCCERWTFAGNRLLVEHWIPEAGFPKSNCDYFAIAMRAE